MSEKVQRYLFKTLTGIVVPAHRFSLFFTDPKLESDYVVYLAEQHNETFRMISIVAISWAIIFSLIYYMIGEWVPDMIYPVVVAVLGGSFLIYAGMWIVKSPKYRKYHEYLYTVAGILYVEMFAAVTIVINNRYSQVVGYGTLDQYPFNHFRLESFAIITVTFACLFRRRVPFTMVSTVFVIFFDIVASTSIVGYSAKKVVELRLPALLASFLTAGVYLYQTDITERQEFLNTREKEKWRINSDDVRILRLLGNGTYGQVFEGKFSNYRIAAKMIFLPKTTSGPSIENKGMKHKIRKLCIALTHHVTSMTISLFRRTDYHIEIIKERQKLIAQESKFDSFEKEIRMMCKLRHPNIVKFMGACLEQPTMLLVTEYCENGCLFDLLENSQLFHRLSNIQRIKLNIALGCAHALEYLHAQNPPILHRDFKSPNVLLDANYNPKICDFGLSEWQNTENLPHSARRASTQTLPNNSTQIIPATKAVGTIPWIAPEIFRGNVHTRESDIYSFAIVCWELYSEQHPYNNDIKSHMGQRPKFTLNSLVRAIVMQDYRPPIKNVGGQRLDNRFSRLFTLAWQREANKRPSWTTIIHELKSLLEQETDNAQNALVFNTSAPVSEPTNEVDDKITSQDVSNGPAEDKIKSIASKSPVELCDVTIAKSNSPAFERTVKYSQPFMNFSNALSKNPKSASFVDVTARQLFESIENESLQYSQLHPPSRSAICSEDLFFRKTNVFVLDDVVVESNAE